MDGALVGKLKLGGTDGGVTAVVEASDATELPATTRSRVSNQDDVTNAGELINCWTSVRQSSSLFFSKCGKIISLP